MKNLLLCLMCCCMIFSTESKSDQTSGSASNPLIVQCEPCSSSADFKENAKRYYWNKSVGRYILTYSESSQALYTILVQKDSFVFLDGSTNSTTSYSYSSSSSSSDTGLIAAVIVSTRPSIQEDFDKYVDFLNSGAEKTALELDYPSTGPLAASGYNNYIDTFGVALILQAWALPLSNLSLFSWKKHSHITITFANGDVATLRVIGFASAAYLPILFVVDKDGNPLAITGAGVTVNNYNGGGFGSNPSGYTTFSWPTGITYCYGACGAVPEGWVIIKRVSK